MRLALQAPPDTEHICQHCTLHPPQRLILFDITSPHGFLRSFQMRGLAPVLSRRHVSSSACSPCHTFCNCSAHNTHCAQIRRLLRRHEAQRARSCQPSSGRFLRVHGRHYILRMERRQPVCTPRSRARHVQRDGVAGTSCAPCCPAQPCKSGASPTRRGRAALKRGPRGELNHLLRDVSCSCVHVQGWLQADGAPTVATSSTPMNSTYTPSSVLAVQRAPSNLCFSGSHDVVESHVAQRGICSPPQSL